MNHEETLRSLCSYVLYAGRGASNHDCENEGDREDHTVREAVIYYAENGEREKRIRGEKLKA